MRKQYVQFYLPLFKGMVMYNNEVNTKRNTIETKDQIEPHQIYPYWAQLIHFDAEILLNDFVTILFCSCGKRLRSYKKLHTVRITSIFIIPTFSNLACMRFALSIRRCLRS